MHNAPAHNVPARRPGCPGYFVADGRLHSHPGVFLTDDEAAVAFTLDLAAGRVHALAVAHQLSGGLLVIDTGDAS